MSQQFVKRIISFPGVLLLVFIALSFHTVAQEITTMQFRRVAPDKTNEFVKRETTYWSKVARKAIDKGVMSFWALFERVDGADMDKEPNFLFINTYPNMDADDSDVWNPATLFPTIPVAKIETYSMSEVTSQFFLRDQGWEQSSHTNPSKDFNYMIMVYHNSSDPNGFIEMEKRHWGPFIKSSMDAKQTAQVGWGNSLVLAPSGNNVRFNSVSYDLFPTLKSALLQEWSTGVKFPETGLDSLMKMTKSMPDRELYRLVKVETKNQ
jgi:hypothetical protein